MGFVRVRMCRSLQIHVYMAHPIGNLHSATPQLRTEDTACMSADAVAEDASYDLLVGKNAADRD